MSKPSSDTEMEWGDIRFRTLSSVHSPVGSLFGPPRGHVQSQADDAQRFDEIRDRSFSFGMACQINNSEIAGEG